MRSRSFAAVATLVALALALAANGSAGGKAGHVQKGGTLIFGAEQEPSDSLNVNLDCCTLAWGTWIEEPVLLGAFDVKPNLSFFPKLVTKAVIGKKPFSVTYYIRKNARWSDGVPVSASDFVFTWRTWMDPKVQIASRQGYDQIARAVTYNAKKVKFVFRKPYAAYKLLFAPVVPAHALRGEDFNKVWEHDMNNPKTGKPIGSGPFVISDYKVGSQLTLSRNPRWWGSHAPYLDKIVYRFVSTTNTEIQAIRGREVDAIYPQPQLPLADLRGQGGLRIETNAGTQFEHLDFNETGGTRGDPMLRNLWVRQAVAYGINRQALVTSLFRTLNPSLKPLHNLIFLPSQGKKYVKHFNVYGYGPKKAVSLLTKHGCQRGGDGIFSCNGKRLSFRFGTTSGNQLRGLAFEIIQAQLKQIGIEVKADFYRSAVFFGDEHLAGHNYDLAMFAWVGQPDPASAEAIYACGQPQNYGTYCSRKVTQLFNRGDITLSDKARTSIYNAADKVMAQDLPSLPLYQKPTFLVYQTKVHDMHDNPSSSGPAWNAENWWVSH